MHFWSVLLVVSLAAVDGMISTSLQRSEVLSHAVVIQFTFHKINISFDPGDSVSAKQVPGLRARELPSGNQETHSDFPLLETPFDCTEGDGEGGTETTSLNQPPRPPLFQPKYHFSN